MDSRLLVSVSGLDTQALRRTAEVIAELDRRSVPVTLLLRPRACAQSPRLASWAKARVAGGDALLMHGYDHVITPSRTSRLGKRAEFAALPAYEASLKLAAARAALESVDLRVDGFAPPRWLASPGTLAALRVYGFTLCADGGGVHDLRTGEYDRARVYTLAKQSARTETMRCFAYVLTAARVARRGGLLRLGVDAADLARPGLRQAFLDAVDVAMEAGAVPGTYAPALTG